MLARLNSTAIGDCRERANYLQEQFKSEKCGWGWRRAVVDVMCWVEERRSGRCGSGGAEKAGHRSGKCATVTRD
jgi:hypothetical protein